MSSTYNILLYFFVLLCAGSALALLFAKNIFKAIIFLLCSLLAVAGIYVLFNAEFIAATQILIYAGGVIILFMFAIMLTSKLNTKASQVENHNIFSGILVMVSIFGILIWQFVFSKTSSDIKPTVAAGVQPIGENLISNYALPFELVALLLLVTVIGAAVMAFVENKKSDG